MRDCGSLDCFYNSRVVDKFCTGECTTSPSIGKKGNCLDYDVHSLEDYKMLTGGKTPPNIKKRVVEGRENSTDDWCDWHNEMFEKAEKEYNI